jgi:hypothetical protein
MTPITVQVWIFEGREARGTLETRQLNRGAR